MYVAFFFSCLTDNRRPNVPSDDLPGLRHMPPVGKMEQSTLGAKQIIALIITFREYNKNVLERRTSAYLSSNKNKHPVLSICCTLNQVTFTDIMLNLDARNSFVLIITINGASHSQHNYVNSSCQHSSATLRPSSGKPLVFVHSDINNHRTHRDIPLKTTMYR